MSAEYTDADIDNDSQYIPTNLMYLDNLSKQFTTYQLTKYIVRKNKYDDYSYLLSIINQDKTNPYILRLDDYPSEKVIKVIYRGKQNRRMVIDAPEGSQVINWEKIGKFIVESFEIHFKEKSGKVKVVIYDFDPDAIDSLQVSVDGRRPSMRKVITNENVWTRYLPWGNNKYILVHYSYESKGTFFALVEYNS